MKRSWLLCFLLLGIACAGAPPSEPAVAMPPGLDGLRLSFTDPATLGRYTVEGPFRHVRSTHEGIELEGFDRDRLQPARVLLFDRDGGLWALLRIDGREFLTRVS